MVCYNLFSQNLSGEDSMLLKKVEKKTHEKYKKLYLFSTQENLGRTAIIILYNSLNKVKKAVVFQSCCWDFQMQYRQGFQ